MAFIGRLSTRQGGEISASEISKNLHVCPDRDTVTD